MFNQQHQQQQPFSFAQQGQGSTNFANQQQPPAAAPSTGFSFGAQAGGFGAPSAGGMFQQQQQQQPAAAAAAAPAFGAQAGQQGGGMFGAGATGGAGGGMFGQQLQNAPGTQGMFGQHQQPAGGTQGIFGQQHQQPAAAPGMFGQQQQPASTQGMFGQQQQPGAAAPGMFGQQQQQQPTGSTGFLGAAAGTPAIQNKPAFSGFGAGAAGSSGGMFGQQQQAAQQNQGMFGAKPQQSAGGMFQPQQPVQQPAQTQGVGFPGAGFQLGQPQTAQQPAQPSATAGFGTFGQQLQQQPQQAQTQPQAGQPGATAGTGGMFGGLKLGGTQPGQQAPTGFTMPGGAGALAAPTSQPQSQPTLSFAPPQQQPAGGAASTLFRPAGTTTSAAPTATTAAPAFPSFGGGGLGGQLGKLGSLGGGTKTPAPAVTGTPATPGSAQGAMSRNELGTPLPTTKPATSTAGTGALGGFGGLGGLSAATASTATASLLAPGTAATTAPKLTTLSTPGLGSASGTVTTIPAAKPLAGSIPALKNKTMEEILNRWSSELESQTKEFHLQAMQISEWDRQLIENSHQISKLHNQLQEAEGVQKDIDQNLEYVEAQQVELESLLNGFESQIRDIFEAGVDGRDPIRMTAADTEREKVFNLAVNLNQSLDEMSKQLSTLIDEINTTSDPVVGSGAGSTLVGGGGPDDDTPVVQIVRILNQHLLSLQWLERSTYEVGEKVRDVGRKAESAKANSARVHGEGGVEASPFRNAARSSGVGKLGR